MKALPAAVGPMQSPRPQIRFEPSGRTVDASAPFSLLEIARKAGIRIAADCGGAGRCGKCRVRPVPETAATPPTAAEETLLGPALLAAGYRLACQTEPLASMSVAVVEAQVQTAFDDEVLQVLPPADPPAVSVTDLPAPAPGRPPAPSLWEEITRAASAAGGPRLGPPPPALWAELFTPNRAGRRAVWSDDRLLGLAAAGRPVLGLAVDLGTTKVAAALMDLASGRCLSRATAINPQVNYGADIMTRMAAALADETDRDALRRTAAGAVQALAEDLCRAASCPSSVAGPPLCPGRDIFAAVIAGNSAMHHLLLGLPVDELGRSPYRPVLRTALDLPAEAAGLDLAAGAQVFFPPIIAGFVGADHTAALAATGLMHSQGAALGIDIGTNTEISLAKDGRLWCCSAASGPAFEGARITDGMRAGPGAVFKVHIRSEALLLDVVGGGPAAGLCGSGLFSAVATLRRHGFLDQMGRFSRTAPFIDGQNVLLAPAGRTAHGRDLILSRRDIGELQLAKAAIRTGIDLLLAEAEIRPRQIGTVVMAGAFGTAVSPQDILDLGLLPAIAPAKIRQVGNASLAGAIRALLCLEERRNMDALAGAARYLELAGHPGFAQGFALATGLCP